MKKILAIAMVTVLALSLLTACGGNSNTPSDGSSTLSGSNPGNSSTPGTNNTTSSGNGDNLTVKPDEIDFGAIMSGGDGMGSFSNLSPEAKQSIIDAGKKDGVEVTFENDGSAKFVDKDGTVSIQKPDGTWVVENSDGSQGQFGGSWPDNALTKLIPKPDFTLFAASGDDESYTLSFSGATLEQARAYVDEIKAAGFTVDAESEDEVTYGIQIFSYDAKNDAGNRISITMAGGMFVVEIDK